VNIAILGGRGIGRIHAGVFHRLGHTVSHVLGTSLASAAEACHTIGMVTGIPPTPWADLGALLDAGPDAVVIATPPAIHRGQILAVAARRIPILCEKPMFWEAGLTRSATMERLAELRRLAANHLFVASPNAYLVQAVASRLPAPTEVRRLRFVFHTQGPYRGRDIGVDLLTHALTVVNGVLGLQSPTVVTTRISDNRFHCRLEYDGIPVEFDLSEDPTAEKRFEFEVNERLFRRVQRGEESTYRVCMLDVSRGDEVSVEDPFVVSARAFTLLAESASDGFCRHFETSARIFESMTRILCDGD